MHESDGAEATEEIAYVDTEAGEFGLYLYYGETGGTEYGIFVDIGSGEIVNQLDLEKYELLRNIVERG